jgi:hypothetical protein
MAFPLPPGDSRESIASQGGRSRGNLVGRKNLQGVSREEGPMRRIAPALIALAVIAAACGGSEEAGRPSPTGATLEARRLAIYEAAIREMVGSEGPFDPILIDERICADAGTPGIDADERECPDGFTDDEQAALLAVLSDLPHVRFVADAVDATRRIFQGELSGAGLISVGVIRGDGDRVEVPGGAYCGGLCGRWMTLVIERQGEVWKVTGTTGPIAIS